MPSLFDDAAGVLAAVLDAACAGAQAADQRLIEATEAIARLLRS